MVSKLRNDVARTSSPRLRAIASPTTSAIANDSRANIVVWFATPMRCKWRSASNPGDTAFAKYDMSASAVVRPSMYSHTIKASSMLRTMM